MHDDLNLIGCDVESSALDDSSPLFTEGGESIVILAPIFHVGCIERVLHVTVAAAPWAFRGTDHRRP